jgi:DNA-binding NtrC family response regulator
VRWKLLGQLPEDGAPRLPLQDSDDLAANLHVLERLLLHRALRRSYGNRVEAARRMGVSRRHLYLLIARHGDPVRGEAPSKEGPKRLLRGQNSRNADPHR